MLVPVERDPRGMASAKEEMAADGQSPVYQGGNAVTIWELEMGALPVYYFRMEGQPMSVEEREGILAFYRETIAKQEAFATLYDLSGGLPGFATHAVPFASFCNGMRPVTEGRLQFTVAVCPDTLYRSILSMILKMAPSHAPIYVVGTLDEAWDVLAHSGDGTKPWDPATETPIPDSLTVSL
jgi:hypothetical protein